LAVNAQACWNESDWAALVDAAAAPDGRVSSSLRTFVLYRCNGSNYLCDSKGTLLGETMQVERREGLPERAAARRAVLLEMDAGVDVAAGAVLCLFCLRSLRALSGAGDCRDRGAQGREEREVMRVSSSVLLLLQR
jgi:hypothetical protein